ncbi:MAG: hypothetical protein JOZ85_00550 [Betaproteobacteria bacterium]|nr:hypothetical protein [Betaproteobacteria bacterium]
MKIQFHCPVVVAAAISALSTSFTAMAQDQVAVRAPSSSLLRPAVQVRAAERPANWSPLNRESLTLEEMMANENSAFVSSAFTAQRAQKPVLIKVTPAVSNKPQPAVVRTLGSQRPANWSPLNREGVTFEEITRYEQ